ncbi:hypothetical protein BJ165DRAFT_1357274 [Panaeolus papilionaceus]|nr:hypothetical protein BJ165DRAFT_1357274 [Panaeolus papilionaceus]
MKSRLVKFKNDNIRGQREGTRSRAIIDHVHDKARAAAAKYRKVREAKLALSGPGSWEQWLRVLLDNDIRSYQDPNKLKKTVPRKGVVEDEDMDVDMESKRDNTGETYRMLSWIWLQAKELLEDGEDGGDLVLMVEWCKSRARANRAREEVLLLQEEMRRTLAYLEWKSRWWLARTNPRSRVDKALLEALTAYATVRSKHQLALAELFKEMWLAPLRTSNPRTW